MKGLTIFLGLSTAALAIFAESADAQWGGGYGPSRCGNYGGPGYAAGGYSGYGAPYVAPYGRYAPSSHLDVHYDRTPYGIAPHVQRHSGARTYGSGRW